MHYLVAVDGSESSTEALEHAIGLAQRVGASLTVVYSVEPRVLVEGGTDAPPFPETNERLYTEDIDAAEERGERALEEAAELVHAADVAVETSLLYGDPVETVTTYAAEEGVDGIFVGHRGLERQAGGAVGSVAKELVQHATVPVTVVK
jgi:nucleotide-binding universal stress UspA family protein